MAKVADKDITMKNARGQTVLLVAKGHEIPDNLDELKEQMEHNPIRTASTDEIDATRPMARKRTEDKARRSSREKEKR